MSNLFRGMFDYVRGNQIYSHWFAMLFQSVTQTIHLGFFVGLIIFSFLMYNNFDKNLYLRSFTYYKAFLVNEIKPKNSFVTIKENTQARQVPTKIVLYNPSYIHAKNLFLQMIINNLIFGYSGSCGAVITLILLWRLLGRHQRSEKIIFQSTEKLDVISANKKIQKTTGSEFKLGEVNIPKNMEKEHILLVGGTGTGKTTCIIDLALQLRKKREKVVIIDTSGALISRFYRPDKDIILNPSDVRSQKWNLWSEASNWTEYENLVEFLLPQTHHDMYWTNAARDVLTSLLQLFQNKKDNQELYQALSNKTTEELIKMMKGLPGTVHLSTSDNQAGSIRSVLSASTRWLPRLDQFGEFSIADWLNKKEDSWLFLSCAFSERKTNINLINLQFNLAMMKLAQLGENLNRRVFFIGDEMASFGDTNNLLTGPAEIRKYGGVLILAMQSLAQLNHLLGTNGAKILLENMGTKVVFRVKNKDTADMLAKEFGEKEITEIRENTSMGIESFRDGVSMNEHRERKLIVKPSELMNLKNREAFIHFSGTGIVTKTNFLIHEIKEPQPEFVAKENIMIHVVNQENPRIPKKSKKKKILNLTT